MSTTLPDAPWRDRPGLATLCAALDAAQGGARFVGGVVRDTLLGLPVHDIDIATRLTPQAVIERVRALIEQAEPDVAEEAKWRKASNPDGVPTWSKDGIICTGETYKDKVKLAFAKGASLNDPDSLFNSSLDGNARRAIDLREGDTLDKAAFIALIRTAIALNRAKKSR